MSLGLGIFLSTLLISGVLLYRWYGDQWGIKRKLKLVAIWSTVIFLFVALVTWGYKAYENFPRKQNKYYDLSLGMSKDSVKYVMGIPLNVLEESKDPKFSGWKTDIEVSKIPDNKSINDYKYWSYDLGEGQPRIDVDFEAGTGKVKSIGCYSGRGFCQSILGIYTGTGEDDVLEKLGKPTSETIEGVTKTMVYERFGIKLHLEKKKVYMLIVLTLGA